VRSEEVAAEVTQAVFLKVWDSLDSFDENKGTFFTWLATIARNKAIDKTRLKSFQHQKNTDSFDLSDYKMSFESNSGGMDLDKLIGLIPEKYRLLIEKMYSFGYTQQEISDEMEIPLGTVKTRLRDAINLLRDSLQSEKHLLYFLSLI
jgi:RNA polymerase sigma-70 factor (ECF subfamily)